MSKKTYIVLDPFFTQEEETNYLYSLGLPRRRKKTVVDIVVDSSESEPDEPVVEKVQKHEKVQISDPKIFKKKLEEIRKMKINETEGESIVRKNPHCSGYTSLSEYLSERDESEQNFSKILREIPNPLPSRISYDEIKDTSPISSKMSFALDCMRYISKADTSIAIFTKDLSRFSKIFDLFPSVTFYVDIPEKFREYKNVKVFKKKQRYSIIDNRSIPDEDTVENFLVTHVSKVPSGFSGDMIFLPYAPKTLFSLESGKSRKLPSEKEKEYIYSIYRHCSFPSGISDLDNCLDCSLLVKIVQEYLTQSIANNTYKSVSEFLDDFL